MTESEGEDTQRAVGGSRNPVADSSDVELLDDAVTDDLDENLSVAPSYSRASRSVSVRGAEKTTSSADSDGLFAVLREALRHRNFENPGHESNEFPQFMVAKDLALLDSYNSFDSIQTVAIKLIVALWDMRKRRLGASKHCIDCPRSPRPTRTRLFSPERNLRSVKNFRGCSIASPLALRCFTSTTVFSGQGRSSTTQSASLISGMPILTRVKHPPRHLWHLYCYSVIMVYRWMRL